MGVYIEALILYILLFFSQTGLAPAPPSEAETAFFAVSVHITRIFFYYIPSITLILYLLFKNRKTEINILKPGKNDLFCGLIAFPSLLITGLAAAFLASFFGGVSAQVNSPSSVSGWLMLCVTCIIAAYLEESFFRFYLLSKKEEMNLNTPSALVLSAALFAICHIYEGPWGVLNAVISGLILGALFLKFRSLHGIAAAHGLYNITAHVINNI